MDHSDIEVDALIVCSTVSRCARSQLVCHVIAVTCFCHVCQWCYELLLFGGGRSEEDEDWRSA